MPKATKTDQVEVLNPRYKGATPEMVGRALLRQPEEASEEGDGDKPEEPIAPPYVRSTI